MSEPADDVPFGPDPVPATEPPGEPITFPSRPVRTAPGTRTLPHDPDVEAALLGCCLIEEEEGKLVDRASAAGVTPDSFYDPRYGVIFEALLALRQRREPTVGWTLLAELTATRQLDAAGGQEFVIALGTRIPTSAEFGLHLSRVLDLATRRELIRRSITTVERAYDLTADVEDPLKPRTATLAPRGIDSFAVPPDDDKNVLLGHRYLNRGDGLIMVSSSGMGKSSMSIQAAVTWALNRPFLGIRPNGALRSLIIQSEDGDGDIGEVWASICHKLNLSPADRKLAHDSVNIVTDRVNRGPAFLAELRRQVSAAKYDLVWINPLAAFMSGDNTTAEAAGDFLRGGLNSLNEPPAFGYIVIQHTTKPPTGKDRSDRRWHEIMYDMAGSYDIIGWARSIISLRPTPEPGEFKLVLAKRGRRAGVTRQVPQGTGYRLESTIEIPIQHCTEKMNVPGINRQIPVIFWEPRDPLPDETPTAKPTGRPKKHPFEAFRSIFPTERKSAIGVNDLHRAALKIKPVGKATIYDIISEGQESGQVSCDTSDPKTALYFLTPKSVQKPEPTFFDGSAPDSR